ncbi:MAG TPA: tetratricopeptide repeat protein [Bryobacteraceae bacterium]|nr:tetratricopeptide repeat protein [Bryobacteraceae bacterium]
MARITRKELKTDRFALEVEHTVSFFEDHQKELIRYGAGGIVVILLIIGYSIYSRHQHTARQEVLAKAIQVQESPVGPNTGQGQSFPTQEAKDEVALKAFGDLASKYSGSEEGEIAQYYLGAIKADQGKLAEAEKSFKEVADKGDAKYASLAKFALAQIYFADGRDDQGEKTLRDLMDHPTIYISKDQATIALARFLAHKKPAEARKLLEPLRTTPGPVGQTAVQAYNELPPG